MKVDLVVYEAGKPHEADFIIRVCIVQDDKTKVKHSKKGVEATLEKTLEYLPDCEFGVWTNGDVFHFLQKECDKFDNIVYNDISDFPGQGQTMDELERSDKISPRKPANARPWRLGGVSQNLLRRYKFPFTLVLSDEVGPAYGKLFVA